MAYADDDDDGGGDLLFFMLLIGGAYFGYQLWRDHQAAAGGGGIFSSSPPLQDETTSIFNLLVPLTLSPTGDAYIRKQEGWTAYPNSSGDIGIGHHIKPGENIVPPISRAEGESLYAGDRRDAEQAVNDGLRVEVSQGQFDALVDFAFNEGRAAFLGSTLLQQLNSGNYAGAAGQFSRWRYAGGQVNSDLVARRAGEQQMFQRG